jgi:hypothetical protein
VDVSADTAINVLPAARRQLVGAEAGGADTRAQAQTPAAAAPAARRLSDSLLIDFLVHVPAGMRAEAVAADLQGTLARVQQPNDPGPFGALLGTWLAVSAPSGGSNATTASLSLDSIWGATAAPAVAPSPSVSGTSTASSSSSSGGGRQSSTVAVAAGSAAGVLVAAAAVAAFLWYKRGRCHRQRVAIFAPEAPPVSKGPSSAFDDVGGKAAGQQQKDNPLHPSVKLLY